MIKLGDDSQTIFVIGFGSIGQALIPFLVDVCHVSPKRILIISPNTDENKISEEYYVGKINKAITKTNISNLASILRDNDIVINVSVDVSSLDLLTVCQDSKAFYIDTCVEPWEGGYWNYLGKESTNAFLRNRVFRRNAVSGKRTAVVAHGANPGLITHFVKEGLNNLGRGTDPYALFSEKMGIKAIQVSEYDTQTTSIVPETNTFYNTWSPNGFLSELWQRAEIGIGSHESVLRDSRLSDDLSHTAVLNHGANTKVNSWIPRIGDIEAFLVPHHESTSISEMLSTDMYRPTVYYAYKPNLITEQQINNLKPSIPYNLQFENYAVLRDCITHGNDSLGALFITSDWIYWYGSILSLETAKSIVKYNNATTLPVVAGIVGAIIWMLENSTSGVVEAEDMDSETVMNFARPFLGEMIGISSDSWSFNKGNLEITNFLVKDCNETF